MKQEIRILKNRYPNKINEYLSRDINLQVVIFLLFVTLCPMSLLAQSYFQTRIGYVTGRYRPLDKNLLNRDEHDFIGGFIVDAEIGRRFGNNRLALLMGGRLQYSQRILKGTYSVNTWEPNVNIRQIFLLPFLQLEQ